MPFLPDQVKVLGYVECLAAEKKAFEQKMTRRYGKKGEGWDYAFAVRITVDDQEVQTLLTQGEVLDWFWEAYKVFFQENPQLTFVIDELVRHAREVYESNPEKDPLSGEDLQLQLSEKNHFIDIVARRLVKMLGYEFHGSELVCVDQGGDLIPGTTHTYFEYFHPGQIPVPARIVPASRSGDTPKYPLLTHGCPQNWFEEGTAESLYQQSRVVVQFLAPTSAKT